MKKCFRVLLLTLLAFGLAHAPASAGLIFDNTSTRLGGDTVTAQQIGNEVQVSGTGWKVTDLEIGVIPLGSPGTANVQAFLYGNDGAGGAPGTLLWRSAVLTDVALTDGVNLIAFAVPAVSVPVPFTWTIQISNAQPFGVGVPDFNPPTVGRILHGWFGGSGAWTNLDSLGVNAHYMARVSALAVPEPTTLMSTGLTLLIGLGWAGIRRRWSRLIIP